MDKNINKIINDCNNSNSVEYVKAVAKEIVLTDPYTICYFAEYVELVDDPTIMPILEKGILSFGDIVHTYEFMFLMVDCQRQYFNLPAFESIIRNSKNPKLMLYCIGFVPGINIPLMLKALYATKCIKYIDKLSEFESELEDIIDWDEYEEQREIASHTDYFPEILKQYQKPGVNLLNSVLQTKDPYLINELADYLEYLRDYKGYDNVDDFLEILGYAMARCKEPLHHYEFAASITFSDKKMFQKLVIDSEMIKYDFYMYEYVDGVDKNELKNVIASGNEPKYINKIGYNKQYPLFD